MNIAQEISGIADQYLNVVQSLSYLEIGREVEAPNNLLISDEIVGNNQITTFYAPFDYINPNARLVIVGLTPGKSQAEVALKELKRGLDGGLSHAEALMRAKNTASFAGPMRKNLIACLDHLEVGRILGVPSVEGVWDQPEKVHFTSTLRYPVLVNGDNFTGSPNALKVPCLRHQIDTYLGEEMRKLSDAVFVPLGPVATKSVIETAKANGIDNEQVLTGIPHPSGANQERINYFLGRKARETLSNRTNPDSIDTSREAMVRKIEALLKNLKS
ncbi:transposase domain-containing protein [Sulfitobacter sp. R18_1]|uniref:transposase domain-containing protein n=1 Tax=Sulfitobacter sp. R18_1 TaxID=2821104 RepID=UPI001ADB99CB|nr:transposase domain-containing protein [Sulfitobacter sp. R18_1]MBO9428265.1 transposase domain-containing protein [Sulfitobacter sp. R18_1]